MGRKAQAGESGMEISGTSILSSYGSSSAQAGMENAGRGAALAK